MAVEERRKDFQMLCMERPKRSVEQGSAKKMHFHDAAFDFRSRNKQIDSDLQCSSGFFCMANKAQNPV